jgi:hypothetical protein
MLNNSVCNKIVSTGYRNENSLQFNQEDSSFIVRVVWQSIGFQVLFTGADDMRKVERLL